MLEFGNKEFRNLQEQVGKNQEDILEIKQGLGDALPSPIAGPEGPQGPEGAQGIQGERGNSVFGVATELPNAIGYKNGDFFLLRNGELYKVVLGKWQLQTSLKGPQGIQGDSGDVEANPEGSASDVISKISINGIIYEVASAYESALSEYLVLNGSTIEVGGDLDVDGNIKINDFENIIDTNDVTLKQYIVSTVDTAVEDQIFRTNLNHAVILKTTSEPTFSYNNWSQYYRADGTKINTEEEFNEYVGEMAYLNPQFATLPENGNVKFLDIPPATLIQRGGGFIAICSSSSPQTYKLIRHTDFNTYFHDQDFLITPELDVPDWCFGLVGGLGHQWIMLDSKLPLQTKYMFNFKNLMEESVISNGLAYSDTGFYARLTIDEHHLNIRISGELDITQETPDYNFHFYIKLPMNNTILNSALQKVKGIIGTGWSAILTGGGSYTKRHLSMGTAGVSAGGVGMGRAYQYSMVSNGNDGTYYIIELTIASAGSAGTSGQTTLIDFDRTFVLAD